jgi:hypothetical protein
MLTNLTTEERQIMQDKARGSKEAKRKWANENLKLSYADETHWRALASEVGFRLAPAYEPSGNTKYIRRLLRHLDKDNSWLELHTGCATANELSKMNPEWTAYAVQGCLLENYFSDLEKPVD